MKDLSLWDAFIAVVGVMLAALLVALVIQEYRDKQSCSRGGGVVVQGDCSIIFCGDGCLLPACTWQCVHVPMEGAR